MNPTKSPVNLLLLLVPLLWSGSGGAQVHLWLTDPDKSIFLKDQTASMPFGGATNENATIDVDEDETFQTIDGFGCCLTGGSATHLIEMNPANRAALL